MSLSLTSIRQQIETAFAEAMEIPIAYSNVPFGPPDNRSVVAPVLDLGADDDDVLSIGNSGVISIGPPNPEAWLKLSITFGQDSPLEVTNPAVYRQAGVIIAAVHVAKNIGTNQLLQNVEAARNVILGFKTGELNKVSCGRPLGPRITPTEDGAWYRGSLQVLFRVLYCDD